MNKYISLTFLLLLPQLIHAGEPVPDPPIAVETFGDQPGTDLGYTTSVEPFDNSSFDFFTVLDNDGTRFPRFTNGATKLFAVEDLDGENSQTGSNSAFLTTTSLNLAGYTNTRVEILLAAPGDAATDLSSFNNLNEYDHSVDDSLIDRLVIEYAADGVNFSEITRFQPAEGTFNSALVQTNTGSNVSAATLNNAFINYLSFPVTAGADAQVRITFQSNSSGELFLVDSISFYGDPPPEFSVADVSAAESAGSMEFTVSRSSGVGSSTIDYATSNDSAVAGVDYTSTSGSLTFGAGETSKAVSVAIANDSLVELNEGVTLTLSNPTGATLSSSASSATGTITNDDSAALSILDVTANEGNTGSQNFSLTVSLVGTVDAAVSVDYATADGTATTADGDYAATSGTLTFGSGETVKTVTVVVNSDYTVESDENLTVMLSNISSAGRNVIFSDSSGQVTITNDDVALTTSDFASEYTTGINTRIRISDLIGNASGGTGSYSIVSVGTPTNGGSVVMRGSRFLIFTPDENQNENTSFTYQLSDGNSTIQGTVNFTVKAPPSNPTANVTNVDVDFPTNATINAAGIPGRTYQLEYSTNLQIWSAPVASLVCPPSGIMVLIDPGPLTANRFYRVVGQ